MPSDARCLAVDDTFGPLIAPECRGGFDFTLLFEQIFLSSVPCVFYLLLCTIRLAQLRRREAAMRLDRFCLGKLTFACSYTALQLVCLVLWCLAPAIRTKASIPSTALSLASALATVPLSYYEHTRTFRPSTIIGVFLGFTLILDAAIVRTLWLRQDGLSISVVSSVGMTTKGVMLLLESQPKMPANSNGQKISKEAASGIYNRILFWWLRPLFSRGYRNNLDLDDLDTLEDEFASADLRIRMKHAWDNSQSAAPQKSRWTLALAVCSAMKYPLLAPMPARLAFIGFSYSQPFLITAAINYVQTPATGRNRNHGYGLIGAAGLVYLGIAISYGQYNHKLYRAIAKIRGSLVSIIYHKTLHLTSTSSTKGSAALTLMSADVDRIALTAEKAYQIWAGTIEVAIAIYLLQRQIGWACIAPLILAAISTAGNTRIAHLIPARLKQWTQATQDRISLTSSILSNIRSIKMTGATPEVKYAIQNAREHELDRSAHFRWFVAFMNLFGALPKLLSAPFTFSLIVFSSTQFVTEGNQLSVARAFTTLALLELLTAPLGVVLAALPQFTAALACLERIQGYLLLDCEREHKGDTGQRQGAEGEAGRLTARLRGSSSSSNKYSSGEEEERVEGERRPHLRGPAVELVDVTLRYKVDSPEIVSHVNLSVGIGNLIMIIGPAGCGKTTLLRGIVGDMVPVRGQARLGFFEVAYCQQSPWLVNATLRENIIGQSAWDRAWYSIVKKACALDEDVAGLSNGDETLIGTGGITLSGGQKQRVALARAVYAQKPIVVLDDAMNALDINTEKAVFDSLLSESGILRKNNTTVIMVTSSVHHLHAADRIFVLDAAGSMSFYDSIDEVTKSQPEDRIEAILSPEKKTKLPAETAPGKRGPKPKPASPQALAVEKEKARRTGDIKSYSTYLRSMGYMRAVLFLVIAMLFVFCSRFSVIWVQWFTDTTDIDRPLFIGVYFLLAVAAAVLSLASFWWMMIIILPISGSNLHKQLLTAVMGAPLAFFTSVDAGVILNRFSQDMNYATAYLPISTMNTVTAAIVILVQFILIATGSGYLALALPVLIAIVYLIQRVYLSTSRQLRFLDLESKSPLYTALNETIEGLPTIRAFGWSDAFEADFCQRLDASQRPVYSLYCIQRWLNLVLDLMVAGLAVLLVALATQLIGSGSSGPGAVGVAMVSVIGFGQALGQFVFYYTDLETSLGAIARIREYTTEIVPEDEEQDGGQSGKVPEGWPVKGEVKVERVSAAYGVDDEDVLRDVSLEITPGQFVGIVGRTGSGKSSLTLALLRLLDLRSGTITIDGIDVSTLPRQLVRSRITTVPQDPFFPPMHSLRRTLAGTAKGPRASDSQLLVALEKVELLSHVVTHLSEPNPDQGTETDADISATSLPPEQVRRILEAKISDLPMSAGQMQLLCLARALLQDNKIVLLDEVTSAIDVATEERVRSVLVKELRGKTVIMVAHREGMMGLCDVVVEMAGGRIVGVTRS